MRDQSFDRSKRLNALNRAQRRADDGAYFLHDEAAKIIAERISVTNRTFENVGFLFEGPHAKSIKQLVLSNTKNTPNQATIVPLPKEHLVGDKKTESLGLKPESFDLFISVFDLHWLNDLPGVLAQLNNTLKPDGLLMLALPAEGSLKELNQCLVDAETQINSGASIRIGPFAQVRTLGDLLRRSNFKLPVADIEQRTINYSSMSKILQDLRSTASNNANLAEVTPISQLCFVKSCEIYKNNFQTETGKLTATINIAFLSGWKEHASQQKPMAKGTAKNQLKDFL